MSIEHARRLYLSHRRFATFCGVIECWVGKINSIEGVIGGLTCLVHFWVTDFFFLIFSKMDPEWIGDILRDDVLGMRNKAKSILMYLPTISIA